MGGGGLKKNQNAPRPSEVMLPDFSPFSFVLFSLFSRPRVGLITVLFKEKSEFVV